MRRVNVYIDGAYFVHGTRGLGFSMDIDLAGLVQSLIGDAQIVRKYFFNSIAPRDIYPARRAHELKIAERFRDQGFEPVNYEAQIKGHVFIDRGIEGGIASRLLSEAAADEYDAALIVSRRPHLIDPIQAVRKMGKTVELRFYEYVTDPVNVLIPHCDGYAELTTTQVSQFIRSGGQPVYAYR